MYALLIALIAMNLARVFEHAPRWHTAARWSIAAAAVLAGILLYVLKWQMSATNVLGALTLAIVAAVIIDIFREGSLFLWRWLAVSVLIFGVAVAFRQIDVGGRLTGPDAWLQGHAIWHVLAAAGLGCVYMYWRSERVVAK